MQGLRQICLATALVAVGPALASAQEMTGRGHPLVDLGR